MNRIEIHAERNPGGQRYWRDNEEWGGFLFCQRGGRLLGLTWTPGASVVLEWSTRPIGRGVKLIVTTPQKIELAGKGFKPARGEDYAITARLWERIAFTHQLACTPIYVRVAL